MDFIELLLVFLLVSAGVTFLLKKFLKADTWFIVSLIKTKKPLKLMESLAKYRKFWEFISYASLVLGFGVIAVDYFFGRKMNSWKKRFLLSLASFFLLCLLVLGLDFTLNSFISKGSDWLFPLFVLVYGLFGFAGLAIALLIQSGAGILINYFTGVKSCPGIAPLIPGIEIPGVPITPPLHVWISLLLILAIHEGSHGITAFVNKLKLKSAGILLLGFLPIGAFVEPDEEEFKKTMKSRPKDAMKMLAAGPGSNLLALILIFVLMLGFTAGVTIAFGSWAMPIKEQLVLGAKISNVSEFSDLCGQKYPNDAWGKIDANSIITKINGNEINSSSDAIRELTLSQNSEKVKFDLTSPEGKNYSAELKRNKLGSIGIMLEDIKNPDYAPPQEYLLFSDSVSFAMDFFNWFFLLNLLIALVNFLPFTIFDGGKIAPVILLPYLWFIRKPKEEKRKLVEKILTWAILAIFLVNALPLVFN